MEDKKSTPLLSLIFITLASLIFLRPFISGLAYPAFELYFEIFIMLLAALTLLTHNRKPGLNMAYGLIILFSALVISTITSINTQNSIKEILKFLSYISIFFIVFNADDEQKRSLIKIIIVSASIISIYTIYQFLWGYQHTIDYLKRTDPYFLTQSSYARDILLSKRAIGTFPSPNILGGYLIAIFFLYLHIFFSTRSNNTVRARPEGPSRELLRISPIILIIIALILTKSLGAWLSLIASLAALVILSYNNFKKHKIAIATSVIFIGSVLAFIIINRWAQIVDLGNPENSITQRLNYWRTAIGVIKNHPIMGVGSGNFQEVFLKYKVGLSTNTRYAHNIFLHMWSETGLLGIIGMLVLVFKFMTSSIRKNRYVFLAGLAFILHNLVDNTFLIPETGFLFWLLLAI